MAPKVWLLTHLLILQLFTSAVSGLSQRSLHRTIGAYSERIRISLGVRTDNHNPRGKYSSPHTFFTGGITRSQARISSSRLHSNAPIFYDDKKQDENTVVNKNEHVEGTTQQIVETDEQPVTRKSGSTSILLGVSVTYLAVATVLAKLNILGPYTNKLLAQDVGTSLLTTVLALAFVKSITYMASKGILEARDSRKIIHMCSAPLFMITWPLFSGLSGARIFAAFVPILQCCRLWLAGTNRGGSDESELAGAISRSGDAAEALKGPFIYVVILFTSIMLFFCDNLTGVVALSTMAAGDGLADIFGRRFGKNNKWPFSESKSIAGSAAFVIAATLCSFGLSAWLIHTGTIATSMAVGWDMAQRIFFISFVSAAVELLPIGDDNWSVPIAAAVLSSILLY